MKFLEVKPAVGIGLDLGFAARQVDRGPGDGFLARRGDDPAFQRHQLRRPSQPESRPARQEHQQQQSRQQRNRRTRDSQFRLRIAGISADLH